MKVGIVVPQFRDSPDAALEVAAAAEGNGLDGVFCFDHLWDLDTGRGPALSCFPLLTAVAARTRTIAVGTLVARVGITSNDVLEREFQTVCEIAGTQRVIAGLGIGDKKSVKENEAYGVPFRPIEDRIAVLDDAIIRLQRHKVTIWAGGRSQPVREAGNRHGVPVNQWDVSLDRLQPQDTWGGIWRGPEQMAAMEEAGVPWAVFLVRGVGDDPEGAVRSLVSARSR